MQCIKWNCIEVSDHGPTGLAYKLQMASRRCDQDFTWFDPFAMLRFTDA